MRRIGTVTLTLLMCAVVAGCGGPDGGAAPRHRRPVLPDVPAGVSKIAAVARVVPERVVVARVHLRRPARASRRVGLAFVVPKRWRQNRGLMEGTPSNGAYERWIAITSEESCGLLIGVWAEARLRPPAVFRTSVGWTVEADQEAIPTIAAAGGGPGIRWFLGPTSGDEFQGPSAGYLDGDHGLLISAVAVVALPTGLEVDGARFAVAGISLYAVNDRWRKAADGYRPLSSTANQRRVCARLVRRARVQELMRVLFSLRAVPVTGLPR